MGDMVTPVSLPHNSDRGASLGEYLDGGQSGHFPLVLLCHE